MKQLLILPLVAGVLVTGCAPKPGAEKNLAIDPSNMDTTVACGEDFYEYACGGWIKKNPLKPEYARYGSFDVLAENNQKQMRELIDELEKAENEPGSVAQKVGDLYKMGLNIASLDIKLLLHLSLLKCIKKDHLLSFNYM
ncbi:hypothetical protein NSB1T_11135 [Coprobacter fastidiosus NSB1 = JCM 33896]|nr:hypothetical protein NSB1T_11135 [Coprobacter fastidiosus NSB1 = JCM 33896]